MVAKQFTHNLVQSPVLVLQDDEMGRYYTLPGGRKYPSVTTVLGELPNEALIKWKKRQGEYKARAIAKAAAHRGHLLHDVLKPYMLNKPVKFLSPFTKELFKKIQPILDGNVNNIRLVEQPLFSDKLGMAGTPDLIAEWNGELAVIDFKTTRILKKEDWIIRYYCQVGAYSIMFNELFGEKVKQNVVIIVSDQEENDIPQTFIKTPKETGKMLSDYIGKLVTHRESEQANAAVTVH